MKLISLFAALFFSLSCTKVDVINGQKKPSCAIVKEFKILDNVHSLVKDYGVICGNDLKKFESHISDTTLFCGMKLYFKITY